MTTNTMTLERVMLIECSECGGHYYAARNIITGEDIYAMCDKGHERTERDFTLEWDERLAWDVEGRLGYSTVEWGE